MSIHCECHHEEAQASPPQGHYRRVLWAALVINAAMFAVEILYGLKSGSVSLLADALDFLGDAGNYGISLFVLGMGVMARARASLIKAFSMGGFGVWVLGQAVWNLYQGTAPDALTMGTVAMLALLANVTVAVLLYAWREGDSNMRSVWLCSRNDALGNIAVALAALGVFGTASGWPDLLVACLMAGLALSAAWQVIRQARQELASV